MENRKDNKQYMKQSFVVAVVAVAVIAVIVVAVFVIVIEAESSNFKGLEKGKGIPGLFNFGESAFLERKKGLNFQGFTSFFFGGEGGGFPLCVGILFSMQNGSLG